METFQSTEQKASQKPVAQAPFSTPARHKGPAVELWQHKASEEHAMRMTGKIAGVQVLGFLRKSDRGAFLAFVSQKQADETYVPVATGSVVSGVAGVPKLRLVMDQTKEVVWVNIAPNVHEKVLVEFGLNVKLRAEKQQAHAAERNAKQEAYLARNT